ncbi:predicted protein [Enterococcus gallinarum EG2]|nr:predicted protein [Enterococcus gallinarum EG2]
MAGCDIHFPTFFIDSINCATLLMIRVALGICKKVSASLPLFQKNFPFFALFFVQSMLICYHVKQIERRFFYEN